MKFRSNILKVSLFATGLSGIVAEYVLSTLATYFLGDSVIQWTMIVSIMLFSMGLGSRLSKYFENNLTQTFILIEFSISIIVSLVSVISYSVASYSEYTWLMIYTLSIVIGLMIGMEIPLVVRLNDEFEILRINISSVLEKDYYGSLIGGIFFAFFGLPYLGLTYTPFVLGAINFIVALVLMIFLWPAFSDNIKRRLSVTAASIIIIWTTGLLFASKVIENGEQVRYKDRVIYSKQTPYQKIVLTQYKGDYWLYINGNEQLSTLDEYLYHEPLVHSVMGLTLAPYDILVLGGGDGCAVREILKYKNTRTITLIDIDPAMTTLAGTNPVLTELNGNSLSDPRVKVINQDAYAFLEKTKNYYDVIIIDLPDPKTVELGRLFSFEFYKMCNRQLRPNGLIITQAGSPYFAGRAFKCIMKSMQAAGFSCTGMHNQVITMGEWGWVIGAKSISEEELKKGLQNIAFSGIPTRWINRDAMVMMTSFGKEVFPVLNQEVEVNTIHNPVLYKYYLHGNWDLY
jgi:spermidine synthase